METQRLLLYLILILLEEIVCRNLTMILDGNQHLLLSKILRVVAVLKRKTDRGFLFYVNLLEFQIFILFVLQVVNSSLGDSAVSDESLATFAVVNLL